MKLFTMIAVMLLSASAAYSQKKTEKSHYEKALAKIKGENFEGALADLNNAIEADSLDYRAYFERGSVKAVLLDHEGALADFDKAIQLHSTEPQYFSERGIAKMNLGERDGACADWKQAASMGFEPAKELAYEYCP